MCCRQTRYKFERGRTALSMNRIQCANAFLTEEESESFKHLSHFGHLQHKLKSTKTNHIDVNIFGCRTMNETEYLARMCDISLVSLPGKENKKNKTNYIDLLASSCLPAERNTQFFTFICFQYFLSLKRKYSNCHVKRTLCETPIQIHEIASNFATCRRSMNCLYATFDWPGRC